MKSYQDKLTKFLSSSPLRLPTKHVAIMFKEFVTLFLKGKRVETRFTKTRCPPFGKVTKGDIVYLKEVGGPIRARALVNEVYYFYSLTPQKVKELKSWVKSLENITYGEEYGSEFSKYATIIFLENIEKVEPPLIIKTTTRAGWIVIKPGHELYEVLP